MKTNVEKVVVITGSTRGIGFGLADSFLAGGCSVTVSGRNQTSVNEAVNKLARKYPIERLFGKACDVSEPVQVQELWNSALERFGRVDIWINNAGIAGPQASFWENSSEGIRDVVSTNLLGSMYGSAVAIRGMQAQGFGSLYNMEGLGSDGRRTVKGLTLYGSTKAGLRYFNDALMQEVQGTEVIVGALRPGMVVTDLLIKPYESRPQDWERVKGIFNILADKVETVSPWLSEQILANHKNGVRISWTSRGKMMRRFLLAPFRKRHVVD